jgi:hypothetical protein
VACKGTGTRATRCGNPGTVGRKTRRALGSVPLPRQSAPVLSRGVSCDTAQENRTAFNPQRRSLIAAPRQRLKTGAEQRKQQQHHRRAEFFALPIVFQATSHRRFAAIPYRAISKASELRRAARRLVRRPHPRWRVPNPFPLIPADLTEDSP